MKPTQKVTNVSNQLPTYYDKDTNILEHVTSISRNNGFYFVLQIYVFLQMIKILKSKNKSVSFKIKLTQKFIEIASQLQIFYDKGTNILGHVTNIS